MYNIFQKAKVSAKVEVTNPEQPKEPAKANEETLTPEANLQKTIEKLKDSINSSFLTCEKYMVEEESSLKVRGESMVRSSSVTTSSMFTKFRSDLNFPPIINSQNYKQDKFLGLCRKERREAPKMPEMSGSNNNSSAPKPPPMNPGENVPIINEPTFQGAKPNFNFNNVTISEIPAKTQPGAGFIPPPPPLPISVVIANGIQMRKDGKMPDKTPVYFQPEVDSGPAVKDGTGADYRDQLSRMLSMKSKFGTKHRPKDCGLQRKPRLGE
jgi:hypothetical protein